MVERGKVFPKDLIIEHRFGLKDGIVAVGLDIDKLCGKEASHAYARYVFHSQTEGYMSKYLNPYLARTYYEKFFEMTGLNADDVTVELYVAKESNGFDTSGLI